MSASIPKAPWNGKDKPEGQRLRSRIGLVMLTFSDHSQGSSRIQPRDFLRIGGLGLCGRGFSEITELKALGASQIRIGHDKAFV